MHSSRQKRAGGGKIASVRCSGGQPRLQILQMPQGIAVRFRLWSVFYTPTSHNTQQHHRENIQTNKLSYLFQQFAHCCSNQVKTIQKREACRHPCIIISRMFNNYIAKKRNRDLHKKLQELRGELEWSNKYRQRVQPSLLAHYEQRVKSFMHQVQENPIVIEETNKTITPSVPRFTFKNAEDWKSLNSISQRINLVKTCSLKKQTPLQSLEKISQRRLLQFSPNKTQYRTRDKLKEIHKPMKFPAHITTKEPTSKRHRSLIVQKEQQKEEVNMVNYNYDNQSVVREKTMKQSDNISDFFQHRARTESYEFQAEEEQRKWDSKEKKLHFKKLMSMYLMGEHRQKQEIKEILNRCGYIRKKERGNEATEVDVFARVVERAKEK